MHGAVPHEDKFAPTLTGLVRLFQVSRYERLVAGSDPELLPVTGAIPQLPGFAGALRCEVSLANRVVHSPQPSVSHREFGVDFDSSPQKGQSSGGTPGGVKLAARGIGFQSFERRCGSLFERSVVLFDRGERFADSGSEFAGNLAQGVQDIFFPGCLPLLFVEDVSGAAVLGAQSQYVLAPKRCNRALQDGGTSGPLADLPSVLRSQPSIRRLAHQTQRLLDALPGDEAQERRLFELYRQSLAKRAVKHGVTRRVFEISEDDGVLVREFWCAVKIEVARRDEPCQEQSSQDQLPALT